MEPFTLMDPALRLNRTTAAPSSSSSPPVFSITRRRVCLQRHEPGGASSGWRRRASDRRSRPKTGRPPATAAGAAPEAPPAGPPLCGGTKFTLKESFKTIKDRPVVTQGAAALRAVYLKAFWSTKGRDIGRKPSDVLSTCPAESRIRTVFKT